MKRTTSTAVAITALLLAGCSGGTTDTTADTSVETPTTEFTATTDPTDTTFTTDTSMTADTSITTDTSMGETSTTIAADAAISGLISDLQAGFADFEQTLVDSGADAEFGAAWAQAQGTLAQSLSDVQAGGTLDMDSVQLALDDFEMQLAGADESVQAAWGELRSALETAMAQIEMTS